MGDADARKACRVKGHIWQVRSSTIATACGVTDDMVYRLGLESLVPEPLATQRRAQRALEKAEAKTLRDIRAKAVDELLLKGLTRKAVTDRLGESREYVYRRQERLLKREELDRAIKQRKLGLSQG